MNFPRSSPKRRLAGVVASALVIATLHVAGGCAAPRYAIVETFDGDARGWVALGEGPELGSPGERGKEIDAAVRLEHGRMTIEGARVLCQSFPLRAPFRGIADLGFAGGDASGAMGIFVQRIGGDSRAGFVDTYSIAVNARGEWKAGAGDPLAPFAIRPWSALAGDASIIETIRFGFEVAGGRIVLRIEGDPRATHVFTSAAADGGVDFRAGVFTNLARASVDNFIAGEDSNGRLFDPAALAHTGDVADGEALLELASQRLADFERAPRRADFVAIVDTLRAAGAAFAESEHKAGVRRVDAALRELVSGHRGGVERAGAEDSLRLLAARLGASGAVVSGEVERRLRLAEDALARGRPVSALVHRLAAAELDPDSGAGDRTAPRPESLRPLRVALGVREGDAAPESSSETLRVERLELSTRDLETALRRDYGRLARVPAGELAITLTIESASRTHERVPATRRVTIERGRPVMTDAQRRELELLEKSLPEDVEDARARAGIVRAGVVTPDLAADLRHVAMPALGIVRLEVHVSDAAPLARGHARLVELRALGQRAVKTSETYMVPAVSVTDVVELRVAYELSLDGEVALRGAVRAIEGLEQWEHDADTARGIPASSHDPERAAELEGRVRRRFDSRLRTALSRERLLGSLDVERATGLLARLAASAGTTRDRDVLAWHLRRHFELRGLTLDAVVRALVAERSE